MWNYKIKTWRNEIGVYRNYWEILLVKSIIIEISLVDVNCRLDIIEGICELDDSVRNCFILKYKEIKRFKNIYMKEYLRDMEVSVEF